MLKIGPGKFAIGTESYRAERVRSCVAVVVMPPQQSRQHGQDVRGLLHYNGDAGALKAFISSIKDEIPAGVAKLAGAGSYLEVSQKNLEAVVAALEGKSVQIVSADVGGHFERTVFAGPSGVFSKQKEYSPFSPAATGLYVGYESLEGRAETVRL